MKIIYLILVAASLHAQGLRGVYTSSSEARTNNCVPRYSTAQGLFVCQEPATAVTWKGAWSSSATYAINDAVSYGGASYIATTAHTNSQPPSSFWGLMASSGGTLAGDVEGSAGSNLVRFVGGQGAASVATATLRALAATHNATPNTIVSRDLSGIFAGTLNGNAATATALAASPTLCPSGQAARGVSAQGDALGCTLVGGGSGTPGGTTGQVQFNNGGAFGGISTTGTGNILRESAVAVGTGMASAYAYVGLGSDGLTPRLVKRSDMIPFVFVGGGQVIGADCSAIRHVPWGGVFRSVHLSSNDPTTGSDISGTVQVQFSTSPATGSTTWTAIGTVTMTTASTAIDSTLTGWTPVVAANSRVRACVIGTPTSILKLSVNAEFYNDPV